MLELKLQEQKGKCIFKCIFLFHFRKALTTWTFEFVRSKKYFLYFCIVCVIFFLLKSDAVEYL